jgi:hypothetical protein
MRILSRDRFRPFVSRPGICLPCPGSYFVLQIFPTRIRIFDHQEPEAKFIKEILLHLQGPVYEFSAQLDLEKENIHVWMKTKEGHLRYDITQKEEVLYFESKKGQILWSFEGQAQEQSLNVPVKAKAHLLKDRERLSLGCFKKQDWDLIVKREEMSEILPFLFLLCQEMPPSTPMDGDSLIEDLKKAIDQNDKKLILPYLKDIIRAGTYDLLVSRRTDEDHRGYAKPPFQAQTSFAFYSLLFPLIRKLFIQESKEVIALLPVLPPELHSGKLTNVKMEGGKVSIEWSNHRLKKVHISSEKKQKLLLRFPKGLQSARFRELPDRTGKKIFSENPIVLKEGGHYFLDQFRSI